MVFNDNEKTIFSSLNNIFCVRLLSVTRKARREKRKKRTWHLTGRQNNASHYLAIVTMVTYFLSDIVTMVTCLLSGSYYGYRFP